MIKAAQEHDMSAIAFDMFFIERSERELDIKDLSSVQDTILSLDEVRDLFPDPDNELASAAGEAGNVYFAQAFFPQPKKKMPVKKRTDVKHSRLMELKDKGFFSIVDPDDFSTLFDFYDIEPPIEELIENSMGTYLFQTVADPDGSGVNIRSSGSMRTVYSLPLPWPWHWIILVYHLNLLIFAQENMFPYPFLNQTAMDAPA